MGEIQGEDPGPAIPGLGDQGGGDDQGQECGYADQHQQTVRETSCLGLLARQHVSYSLDFILFYVVLCLVTWAFVRAIVSIL